MSSRKGSDAADSDDGATTVVPPGDISITAAAPVRRSRDAETAFTPGDTVADRYHIRRFIAFGGMGEVYEAEDLVLREVVALKTIRPDVADDQAIIERFKREILLARRVTHINVCRIFDLGIHAAPGK